MAEQETTFVNFEQVPLRSIGKSEQWLEGHVVENTALLGLGDLSLIERQREQPTGGRLDLLLQDDDDTRYVVELQLGTVNPSHIIRTIEYWDTERKRYPRYDHFAVLVAEDITSRFLNVLSLFNGMIPLIAIQVNAFKDGTSNTMGLNFVRVFDPISLGTEEEDEAEVTDRMYWENKGSKQTVRMADDLLEVAKQQCNASLELKYNKHYIGLAVEGKARNFFICRPKKSFIRFEIKLDEQAETQEILDNTGWDVRRKYRRYIIPLRLDDIKEHEDILATLMKKAYDQFTGEDA